MVVPLHKVQVVVPLKIQVVVPHADGCDPAVPSVRARRLLMRKRPAAAFAQKDALPEATEGQPSPARRRAEKLVLKWPLDGDSPGLGCSKCRHAKKRRRRRRRRRKVVVSAYDALTTGWNFSQPQVKLLGRGFSKLVVPLSERQPSERLLGLRREIVDCSH